MVGMVEDRRRIVGRRAEGGGLGRRQWALLGLMASCACVVEGGNFQFGTMGYELMDGKTQTVIFQIRTQWLRSYSRESVFVGSWDDMRAVEGDVMDLTGSEPVELDPGDGSPPYSLKLKVLKASVRDDFVYGVSVVVHTYTSGETFSAALRGCCRQSQAGKGWNIVMQVDLSQRSSLVSWGLPVQTVYTSGVSKIMLPATTVHGEGASYWRLGQGLELGGATIPAREAVYFQDVEYLSGVLTVNASLLAPGLYPVVAVISNLKTSTSYDFTLNVVNQTLGASKPFFAGAPWNTGGVVQGYAGYEVFVTLFANTSSPGRQVVEIREFGMMIGAIAGNSRRGGIGSQQGFYRDFSWTPGTHQIGGRFSVCFEAIDDFNASSGQWCLQIDVLQDAGGPLFKQPENSMTPVSFRMLTRGNVSLVASSANPYAALVIRVSESTPLRLTQHLSSTTTLESRHRATDTASQTTVFATFAWTPGVEHGGYKDVICFDVYDKLDLQQRKATTCLNLEVLRCRYLVQPGDTYETIMKTFEIDWLTLWGLNVEQKGLEPVAGNDIRVGRLYTVGHGDTLLSISKEFGTSVASIRRLNFDFGTATATGLLKPDSVVCVLPNTCSD